MKFLKKLKSSNFWVSMISAVVLILQAVFNVDIKTEYLNQIILGILGLLVMSGIVTDTNNDEVTVKQTLDLDSVKETISNIFTCWSATLKTDMANVVSQFEKLNTNQNTTKDFISEIEDNSQNLISSELKNDDVKETLVAGSEEKAETEVVEQNKTETTQIQPVMQETNVPKNEL